MGQIPDPDAPALSNFRGSGRFRSGAYVAGPSGLWYFDRVGSGRRGPGAGWPLLLGLALALAPAVVSAQPEPGAEEPAPVVEDDDDLGDLIEVVEEEIEREDAAGGPKLKTPAEVRPGAGAAALRRGGAPASPAPTPGGGSPAVVPAATTGAPGAEGLGARPGGAPETAPAPATEAPAPADCYKTRSEADLRRALETRARARRDGKAAEAELALTQLQGLRRELGLRNVPLASALLVRESRRTLEANETAQARALALAAAELSPDMVDVQWMGLRATVADDPTAVAAIFRSLGRVLGARLGRVRNQVALATDALAIFGLTLLALASLFALIHASRYARYLAHDLRRTLPSWFTPLQGLLALLLLWIAPVLLGLGLVPALALVLASLLAYQTARERALGLLLLVGLTLSPLAMLGTAPLVAFHGSLADALEAANEEAFADDAERRLVAAVEAGDRDPAIVMSLAHRAELRGDLRAAIRQYREALAAEDSPVARNNLGRLLYLCRERDAAFKELERAAGAGGRAEPSLNLASLLLDQARFPAAQAAIDRARDLDAELARRYGETPTDTPTEQKLLAVPVDLSGAWGRLLSLELDSRLALADHVWRTLGSRLPVQAMPIVGLVLLLLGGVVARKRLAWSLSHPCPKCGQPAPQSAPRGYCEQCQTLFLNAVTVEPATRARKERAIERYQTRRSWAARGLSLFAGAGEIYASRPFWGFALAFGLLGSGVAWLWLGGLSSEAWAVWLGPGGVLPFVTAAVAGLATLWSIRRAL